MIPFIPGVEFNRGALNYYNDSIYAGSIEGVFVIDTYHVIKNFLPKYHTVPKAQDQSEKITLGLYILAFLGIVTLAIVGILMYRRKRFRVVIIQKSEEKNTFSLEEMEESIKNFNIHTVEALAEHYKTNAVQLNRIFKNFDTTPGKFMKTVKLDFAKQLLLEKVPMEDVVYRVGYSAQFIKKELQIP